jgi:hypothetical protein
MVLSRMKAELAGSNDEKLAAIVGHVVEDHQLEIAELKKEIKAMRESANGEKMKDYCQRWIHVENGR